MAVVGRAITMRSMPRWDEPSESDEIAALLADLDAAQSLIGELPVRSRDRELVLGTIDHLTARLLDCLAPETGGLDATGAHPMSRQEVPNVPASLDGQTPEIVRRLANWRTAEQATATADTAVAEATKAAEAAERAATLVDRVAKAALEAIASVTTTSDHATEAAETLRRDASAAAEEAATAVQAAAAARERSEAAKAAFRELQGTPFERTR